MEASAAVLAVLLVLVVASVLVVLVVLACLLLPAFELVAAPLPAHAND